MLLEHGSYRWCITKRLQLSRHCCCCWKESATCHLHGFSTDKRCKNRSARRGKENQQSSLSSSGIEYCILWQADRGVAGMGSWLVHRDFLTHSLTIHSSGWMSSLWWNFFLISLLTCLFYSLSKFCKKGEIQNSKLKFFLGVSNRQKSKSPWGSPDFHFYYLFMYHSIVWMNVLDVMKLFSYHTFLVSPFFFNCQNLAKRRNKKWKLFLGEFQIAKSRVEKKVMGFPYLVFII